MRTQRWIGLGVVVALGALMSQAAQAEGGRPSRQTLEQMGLGSLVVMSDGEAQAIRGQGFLGGSHVSVVGNSFATISGPDGGAHSENAYAAEGKHDAKGSNFSFAGVKHTWSGPMDNGDWGNPAPTSKYNRKPRCGYPGGGYPGNGGGWPKSVHSTVFFAGGHSSAWAF